MKDIARYTKYQAADPARPKPEAAICANPSQGDSRELLQALNQGEARPPETASGRFFVMATKAAEAIL